MGGAQVLEPSSEVVLAEQVAPAFEPGATLRLDLGGLPRSVVHPGVRIASYTILRPLGEGGYGRVYVARDRQTRRLVALKLLSRRPEVQRSFQREARAGMCVRSPFVAKVLALGTHWKTPYLVLELVEGESLWERVGRAPRLKPREVVDIGARLARGVASIHAAGLRHRDLKAANVIIDPQGEPRLIDFGFAASDEEAREEGLVGTPGYWAPELHARELNDPLDARAVDLYALGCILHLCLTRRLPHMPVEGNPRNRDAAFALLARRARGGPADLAPGLAHVPPPLASHVLSLLARDPAARPPADEVAARLAGLTTEAWAARQARRRRESGRHAWGYGSRGGEGGGEGQAPR
ncbi:MAG: serine/threonine-protein kinase [Planctomycetota bacterium]